MKRIRTIQIKLIIEFAWKLDEKEMVENNMKAIEFFVNLRNIIQQNEI